MDSKERKEKMINATTELVAQKGLESFSVAQAALNAHINEALVYRDFGTKENLMNLCFIHVNEAIINAFKNEQQLMDLSIDSVMERTHQHWKRLLCFLVENKNITLFYQQYRDSSYKMNQQSRKTVHQYDVKTKFEQIFLPFIKDQKDIEYVSDFVVDGMVMFAKKMITGEIPNTEITYDRIWQLTLGGMREFITIKNS